MARITLVASLLVFLPLIAPAADVPPEWAYSPFGLRAPPDDGTLRHVPGSSQAYPASRIDDLFDPPDWFPDEHPTMPEVVAHGRKPDVNGCAMCHLTTGLGHPESGNVTGLPVEYFEEQVRAFASGERANLLASRTANMIRVAKGLTADEIHQAATYFTSMRPTTWTRVIETDTVPKGYPGPRGKRPASDEDGTGAIGHRIIELADEPELARLRDPHSPYTAYVPTGSIKAGETLAKTGGGKTLPCDVCHGPDYKGIGNVPRLAGLSAIYIFRQLNDIQKGARHGSAVALMQPVVANLSDDDMIALAAFMASRTP
jgi:cytochrome c553